MEILFGKWRDGRATFEERRHINNPGRDGVSVTSRIAGEGVATGTLVLIVARMGTLVAVVAMFIL